MTVHEAPIGATVEWYTPPEFFRRLDLTFDLDPASPGAAIVPWVPAVRHYTIRDNGLTQPWEGRVWLNPPYGEPGVTFIKRMIEHGNGVMLLPSRTETRIFQSAARAADAIVFIAGRIAFIRADGFSKPASFASALLVYGRAVAEDIPLDLGWTVRQNPEVMSWLEGVA